MLRRCLLPSHRASTQLLPHRAGPRIHPRKRLPPMPTMAPTLADEASRASSTRTSALTGTPDMATPQRTTPERFVPTHPLPPGHRLLLTPAHQVLKTLLSAPARPKAVRAYIDPELGNVHSSPSPASGAAHGMSPQVVLSGTRLGSSSGGDISSGIALLSPIKSESMKRSSGTSRGLWAMSLTRSAMLCTDSRLIEGQGVQPLPLTRDNTYTFHRWYPEHTKLVHASGLSTHAGRKTAHQPRSHTSVAVQTMIASHSLLSMSGPPCAAAASLPGVSPDTAISSGQQSAQTHKDRPNHWLCKGRSWPQSSANSSRAASFSPDLHGYSASSARLASGRARRSRSALRRARPPYPSSPSPSRLHGHATLLPVPTRHTM